MHAGTDQYNGNCTAGCKRTVNGKIGKILKSVCNIYTQCHQPPDQPLRKGAGHGTEEIHRV